ncbi:MAG: hypothetical protein ACUZ8E_07125 [Candidatus Anammoxibacter sp.]
MKVIKASDYLYDLGLGLEPKYDKFIIEAIESFHQDKIHSVVTDLKIKELAGIRYMRDNLANPKKADNISHVSAKNEAYSEIIELLRSN